MLSISVPAAAVLSGGGADGQPSPELHLPAPAASRPLANLPFLDKLIFCKQPKAHFFKIPRKLIICNVNIATTPKVTKSSWKMFKRLMNLFVLLIMGGIEKNPGPDNIPDLNFAHVNINSITAEGKLNELTTFANHNKVHILGLTEAKINDNVHPSLYTIPDFHAPILKNRSRFGGGVALYARKSLPIQRLTILEHNEEWVWAKFKVNKFTVVVCITYLPPNQSSTRLESFRDHFCEAICLSKSYKPDITIMLGDLNVGNVFLEDLKYKHSGITPFDKRFSEMLQSLHLTQLIDKPTRVCEQSQNLRDLIDRPTGLTMFLRVECFHLFQTLIIFRFTRLSI